MIKKMILMTLVPMTLTLQGAFVMKKGQPLKKVDLVIEDTPINNTPYSITEETELQTTPTNEPTKVKDTSTIGKKIFEINFNKYSVGKYTMGMFKKDFTNYNGEHLASTGTSGPGETLSIVQDNNEKVLRVLYKKGKRGLGNYPNISSYSGFQTTMTIPKKNRPKEDINNPQEVTLEYYVKFENNFKWVIGGKLPGLAGGSVPAGGRKIGIGKMTNGFSARFMWHNMKGKPGIISYIYHPGRAGSYGQKVYGTGPLMSQSNPATSLSSRNHNSMLVLKKNKWYKIRQTIKANTPGKSNGIMKVWINDKPTASFGGMKYIADGKHGSYSVDKLFFSTFYGGGDLSYAPPSNTYTRFKQIKIYVK